MIEVTHVRKYMQHFQKFPDKDNLDKLACLRNISQMGFLCLIPQEKNRGHVTKSSKNERRDQFLVQYNDKSLSWSFIMQSK